MSLCVDIQFACCHENDNCVCGAVVRDKVSEEYATGIFKEHNSTDIRNFCVFYLFHPPAF
jgi:hypothetical protein